jgi:DNA primase
LLQNPTTAVKFVVCLLESQLFLSLYFILISQQNNKKLNNMTLNEIKQISIREYLGRMNIQPVKDYGYYGMYHCPYREDRNASFKVDFRQNLWHDFGTNEGGSIIDLLMKLNKCSMLKAVTEANKYFSTSVNQHDSTTIRQMDNFSFHRNNSFEDKSAITIQYIIQLPIRN